jgi:O-antigen ligase
MVNYISKFKFINFISYVFGVFIFLPFKFKPLVLSFFVIYLFINRKNINIKPYRFFFSYFIVVFSTLIYCTNIKVGFDFQIRILPFLIIPLFFSALKSEDLKVLKSKFISVFIYSSFFYSLLVWGYLYYIRSTTHFRAIEDLLSYITYGFFGINEHPIYLSCIFGVSIIFLFLKNNKSKVDYFLIFFLILTIILFSRKMIIITLFLILLTHLFLVRNINKSKIFFTLSSLTLCFLIIYNIPEISNRFSEMLNFNQIDNNSSTGKRLLTWKLAFDIFRDYWQFGVTWGDSQDYLNIAYKKINLVDFHNHNTHNQYLQILLSSGVIGFLIISIEYVKIFIKNFKENIYFVLTQIIFLSLFLVENYLERQNGIIFFVFITCLFVKNESFNKIQQFNPSCKK